MLQAGEPVPSKKEWIQKLLAKPGDKDLLGLLVLKCGRAFMPSYRSLCWPGHHAVALKAATGA